MQASLSLMLFLHQMPSSRVFDTKQACRRRGVPWHPQTLIDQLTLSQLGRTDYAHLTTIAPPPPHIFIPSNGPDKDDINCIEMLCPH